MRMFRRHYQTETSWAMMSTQTVHYRQWEDETARDWLPVLVSRSRLKNEVPNTSYSLLPQG